MAKIRSSTRTPSSNAVDPRLRQAEERFRLFMENVKEYAVFMLDTEGRVVDWNLGGEQLLGYGPEIVGQHYSAFFPADDREAGVPQMELRRAAEHGQASDDRWHIRKDGTYFWAQGITTAMRDDDGSLKGFTKVLRDSTERKRFEEQLRERNAALEEADRRKDEFLAVLAHELRNPLAPIVNALAILNKDDVPSAIQKEAAAVIDRQARALARLVDDLMDVSRVATGKIQLRRQRVSLNEAVQHALASCKPQFDARRHEVVVRLPSDAAWVDGDAVRIEQVLTNLINNACKYTPPSGRIEIELDSEPGRAVLRVRDNGIGIGSDLLPHVFDMFRQGERSLDRGEGGLGIGLTLVRRLVEMHGGSVQVLSDGPGQGAEFVVTLPLISGTQALAEAAPAESAAPTSPLRILVVDDNRDAAQTLALALSMKGHDASVAYDGDSAFELARRTKPDAVLLDIGLPGLSGYEVAARMSQDSELTGAVLIAMTGYGQETARQRSFDVGFAHHLVKPVHPDEVDRLLALVARPHTESRNRTEHRSP